MIAIKAILQSEYNILEAADGEEGLKIALLSLADLILGLPGLLKKIMSRKKYL